MEYGIRELSRLAGVSARTLRYYDEIGLLKPLGTSEAGYRFYGDEQVALLQQILFYRERGMDLKSIQRILYETDFNLMDALKEHLQELEAQRAHVDSLIRTVKQTISAMKGECQMSDKEKFRAFQEQRIRENEARYGREIREKYGDEQVDAGNRRMLHMSQEEWNRFQSLEADIRESLKEAVKSGVRPEDQEGRRIAELHREWLSMAWESYTPEAHKSIAAMYVCDERFTKYYDGEVTGCAALLEKMVRHWADQLEA